VGECLVFEVADRELDDGVLTVLGFAGFAGFGATRAPARIAQARCSRGIARSLVRPPCVDV
jgi:hypothetical protein